MKASEIRAKYLKFFASRGHAIIPAAPIIPPDDPTTLFTSSGMQQMVPYLKGTVHPMGKRIVDSQPSFRTDDIEEVGDNRHTCMFEMLGNWSLGDYFKAEQLDWFFTFLTSPNYLSLDTTRIFITIFKGDEMAPKDSDSEIIWRNLFIRDTKSFLEKGIKEITANLNPEKGMQHTDRIFYYGTKKNWWSRAGTPDQMPVGEIGGPDSEVFYDFGEELNLHENSIFKDKPCHPNCDCGRFLEIGNSVFMEYEKKEDGLHPLPSRNVDFGGGLERLAAASQNSTDIFTTDLYKPIIDKIIKCTGKEYIGKYIKPMRIIADHIKASTFLISEDIEPSNKKQGYVLRKLLRRAIVNLKELEQITNENDVLDIVGSVFEIYQDVYFQDINTNRIKTIIGSEISKFARAIEQGLPKFISTYEKQFKNKDNYNLLLENELKKYKITPIKFLDTLTPYTSLASVVAGIVTTSGTASYGLPYESMLSVINKDHWLSEINEKDLLKANKKSMELHQELSRTASAGMFKGGLADSGEITTKYHTATHLLHQALHDVLGDEIQQAGSNITSERLRFDYTYTLKPTPEQLKKISEIINDKITDDLPVVKTIEDKTDALKSGARAFFAEKYPDKVSVYTIGDYSKELCGGPHVETTGAIGKIQIYKDESLGSGKRRIYAKL